MRVIAGLAKGMVLTPPKGQHTRPTADRMKEDLFNIISEQVKGAVFLDLYCGSAAIGIEALSRGAKSAVFVDFSAKALAAAGENLRKTRLEDQAKLLAMPVLSALELLARELPCGGKAFDIIFIDPPYDSGELTPSLEFISQSCLLNKNGIVVAECRAEYNLPDFSDLVIYKKKKYAQTQFAFFKEQKRHE